MHVLEAVLIASIMISAVAFVATFDVPPSGTARPREQLSQKAEDALKILYDTPTSSPLGDNMLSVLVMECLQGKCDNLRTRLSNLLPEGAEYSLSISNGASTYPIINDRAPSGEAVTYTHPLEPRWSSNFVSVGADTVDPSFEPLLVYSLPVFNSNPVRHGGSPIQILVHGTRESDGSDYILTSFVSTVAYDAAAAPAPAVSLYFTDEAGQPIPSRDVRSQTMSGQTPTGANVTFRLRLNESGGKTIGPGTELSVYIPRGWSAWNHKANDANWTVTSAVANANASYVGSTLAARLIPTLNGNSVDFLFNATYHRDSLDYYAFRAQAGRDAQAFADLLVRADQHSALPPLEVPSVHVSAPRPMGAADNTTWTLSVAIPLPDPATPLDLDEGVTIKSIEFIEQNGAPIFGSAATIAGASGAWNVQGATLAWTGEWRVTHRSPLNLTFNVTGSGTAGALAERGVAVAPVKFDKWTGRLLYQTSPGMFRGEIYAANGSYAGYQNDTGAFSKNHTFTGNATYRSTALDGASHFRAAKASTYADSLYGSYVSVANRTVPTGGTLTLQSNVQSMLFALAQAGQEAGVSMKIYPPWAGDTRTPIYTQDNLEQGLLTGAITQVELHDFNGDGYEDPLIGTSNGHVLALDAITGDRLPGNVWIAPLTQTAEEAGGHARINVIRKMMIGGQPHFVVGTDANSEGVFVLSASLQTKWYYRTQDKSVIDIDVTTDVDGTDGRADIIVGMISVVNGEQTSDDALIYVFRTVDGQTQLVPYAPSPILGFPDVFYLSTGTPNALVGLANVGPYGTSAGLAVTVQSLVDGGAQIYRNATNPADVRVEQVPLSTPRAGLAAVNASGRMTSVLFGTPVTKALAYNYNNDGITDILGGGVAGYVIMANGSVLTQPIYSYLVAGTPYYIDADTPSSVESYVLASNGKVVYTDDAFQTFYGPTNTLTGALAISSNATNSFWVVGTAGTMWRSIIDPSSPLDDPNYLNGTTMLPVIPVATRNNVVASITLEAPNLNDVWFRGLNGWVVGSKCLTCDEALVMRTTNGGHTWTIATHQDDTLETTLGAPITAELNTIKFWGGVGWIVGNSGTILRSLDGATWRNVTSNTTQNLNDIACDWANPDRCMVVGANGTVIHIADATKTVPRVTAGKMHVALGDNLTRDLYSVGIVNSTMAYAGAKNMVLASFDGGNHWSTLPLNYLENDAHAISVNADGTGFIFGGSGANARIWFIHDYGTESSAQTKSYASSLPAGAKITSVNLEKSNASVGASTVEVLVSTNGNDWRSMGNLKPPGILEVLKSKRNYSLSGVSWNPTDTGRDFRVRFLMNTSGDRTITSPHLRSLEFRVNYTSSSGDGYVLIKPDFSTTAELDAANTTAMWDTAIRELHMPYVREFWTRNVSGAVLDIMTGYNSTGNSMPDVYVGTGGIIAMNSPDYAIYASSNMLLAMEDDNRVYLLDGSNGTIVARSKSFLGNVTHLRAADADGDLVPERIFATTWDGENTTGSGRLYALHHQTLEEIWNISLGSERPDDIEVGTVATGLEAAYVVTTETNPGDLANSTAGSIGYIWSRDAPDGAANWRRLPDEMGRYIITKEIPFDWLFGAYVVEVEVKWTDKATRTGLSNDLLRSARFYDYFEVAPPNLLSPASPVYNVHLTVWFPDWG